MISSIITSPRTAAERARNSEAAKKRAEVMIGQGISRNDRDSLCSARKASAPGFSLTIVSSGLRESGRDWYASGTDRSFTFPGGLRSRTHGAFSSRRGRPVKHGTG